MNRRIPLMVTVLLLASLACSTALFNTAQPTPQEEEPAVVFTAAPVPTLAAEQEQVEMIGSVPQELEALYKSVNPGVVSIIVYSPDGIDVAGPLGQGSGFVIDREGHIVTNHHVVDGAGQIEIDFPSGLKSFATLIGTDPDSDLAVLQVDVPTEHLTPLPLGDSDQVQVGEFVVAIGNPFGLSSTMTVGVISAKGRTLESERLAPGGQPFTAGDIIQTDAAINPGNSGGPLIDVQGRVIGVNRAIRTDSTSESGDPVNSGIGFAVPVNIVRRVVPVLIDEGEFVYPLLGISSLSDDLWNLQTLELLNLPPDAEGAYVTCVTPGGPAEEGGVQGAGPCSTATLEAGGDLIIGIEDQDVRDFSGLLSYLINNTSPGDTITLTVLRDGEQVQVDVRLAGRQ